MPNANGNGFPSMSDLLFLKSMNALTPDQVKMYYEGNAINAQQATQLGYKPVNTINRPAAPKQAVQSSSAAPKANVAQPKSSSVSPTVNPQANPNTNPVK